MGGQLKNRPAADFPGLCHYFGRLRRLLEDLASRGHTRSGFLGVPGSFWRESIGRAKCAAAKKFSFGKFSWPGSFFGRPSADIEDLAPRSSLGVDF